jgi:hypothetical protein
VGELSHLAVCRIFKLRKVLGFIGVWKGLPSTHQIYAQYFRSQVRSTLVARMGLSLGDKGHTTAKVYHITVLSAFPICESKDGEFKAGAATFTPERVMNGCTARGPSLCHDLLSW